MVAEFIRSSNPTGNVYCISNHYLSQLLYLIWFDYATILPL